MHPFANISIKHPHTVDIKHVLFYDGLQNGNVIINYTETFTKDHFKSHALYPFKENTLIGNSEGLAKNTLDEDKLKSLKETFKGSYNILPLLVTTPFFYKHQDSIIVKKDIELQKNSDWYDKLKNKTFIITYTHFFYFLG